MSTEEQQTSDNAAAAAAAQTQTEDSAGQRPHSEREKQAADQLTSTAACSTSAAVRQQGENWDDQRDAAEQESDDKQQLSATGAHEVNQDDEQPNPRDHTVNQPAFSADDSSAAATQLLPSSPAAPRPSTAQSVESHSSLKAEENTVQSDKNSSPASSSSSAYDTASDESAENIGATDSGSHTDTSANDTTNTPVAIKQEPAQETEQEAVAPATRKRKTAPKLELEDESTRNVRLEQSEQEEQKEDDDDEGGPPLLSPQPKRPRRSSRDRRPPDFYRPT